MDSDPYLDITVVLTLLTLRFFYPYLDPNEAKVSGGISTVEVTVVLPIII